MWYHEKKPTNRSGHQHVTHLQFCSVAIMKTTLVATTRPVGWNGNVSGYLLLLILNKHLISHASNKRDHCKLIPASANAAIQ